MKFTILTLTTMFVMVYAASKCKKKEQLLDDILQSVLSLEKQVNESKRNPNVKKISSTRPPTCVKGFFCLAEKTLVDANISSAKYLPDAEKLIRQLSELNKKSDNCTLNTTAKYPLTQLLKDICKCTPQYKKQLNKCLE